MTLFYIANTARGFLVAPSEIQSLESHGNYTKVTLSNGKQVLIRRAFKKAHGRLEPHGFFRISRWSSINLGCVKEVKAYDGKRLSFTLTNDVHFIASTAGSRALRAQLSL